MRGTKQLKYVIHFARIGCTNRPFYQICVTPIRVRKWESDVVEQVGCFDPIPNESNEKLVALNMERLKYWIAKDCHISKPVLELLGLSGFLPVHPLTYMRAKYRKLDDKRIADIIAKSSRDTN